MVQSKRQLEETRNTKITGLKNQPAETEVSGRIIKVRKGAHEFEKLS